MPVRAGATPRGRKRPCRAARVSTGWSDGRAAAIRRLNRPGGRATLRAMPHFERRVPDGDTHERDVCVTCGFIAYQNPKIVVGSVVVSDDGRVLLCRRAIEPRAGFWTLPAGYMEFGETCAEAARREAREEANAELEIEGVLAIYTIARIGQVQVIHRARFARPGFSPGEETLETRLFAWEHIPWAEIAFPSVHWALRAWHAGRAAPLGAPSGNPPEDARGMKPLPHGA